MEPIALITLVIFLVTSGLFLTLLGTIAGFISMFIDNVVILLNRTNLIPVFLYA